MSSDPRTNYLNKRWDELSLELHLYQEGTAEYNDVLNKMAKLHQQTETTVALIEQENENGDL